MYKHFSYKFPNDFRFIQETAGGSTTYNVYHFIVGLRTVSCEDMMLQAIYISLFIPMNFFKGTA